MAEEKEPLIDRLLKLKGFGKASASALEGMDEDGIKDQLSRGEKFKHASGRPFSKDAHRAVVDGLGLHDQVHDNIKEWLGLQRGTQAQQQPTTQEAAQAATREADAQQKGAEVAQQTAEATQKTAGKLNRLLSSMRGLFGKGAAGLKGAALGAKAAGGAAVGAGLGAGAAVGKRVGNVVVKTGEDVARSGFWIVLTAALWLIDFLFWRFGGIDYNIPLNAIKAGGLAALLRIVLPFYVVIVIVIILALRATESEMIGFFLAVVFIPLIIINHFGFNYNIYGVSITVISLIVSTFIVSLKLGDEKYHFYSWVLLFMTGSAIISLGGFFSGIHHLFVAALIWLFLLKSKDERFTRANYGISVLLLLDFFGFGLWQSLGPMKDYPLIANRFVFPLWFLFVLVYTAGERKSPFAKLVLAGTIFFYLVVLVDGYYGWENIQAQVKAHPEEIAEAKSFFEDGLAKIKAFPGKIVEEYKRGMTEATGGYYQGKVEENQDPKNELGVHIDDLQAADKEFYQNEGVVVWGDLKARTLDKPVYIYMSCESDDIKGVIKPDKLADSKKGYEIERLEEIPFECRFSGGQLKAGTNNVKVRAEFNFRTLGYLKTYFMDVERMRALRKENIDPLRQYGIDKKPQAVFTNGPVKLGMGTVDPPVGLSTTSEGYSYIGVTVQPQWYGRIKNITNLTIQVPKDLQVEKEGERYCRKGFEKVEEDSEGYSVYRMIEEEIKKIKTPIDAYKSWRCSISIPSRNVPEILGNTPVAVYYYRADVDYIYEIEKSTSVYVKAVEGEKRVLLDCKTECDDSDGCVCNAEGCGIQKGESIGEGYTCDNYPSGSNVLRGYERTISDVDNAIKFIDAYLALNDLCAQGLSDKAEEELGKSELEDEEKKEMGELLEDCRYEDKKINYIESGENKIVDKIEDTVNMFKNAKVNLQEDLKDTTKKDQLNSKKTGFIGKIDEVKGNFENIKKYMKDNHNIDIMDIKYYEALDKAKTDLEGITY